MNALRPQEAVGCTRREVVLRETTHKDMTLTEVVHRDSARLGGESGAGGCIAAWEALLHETAKVARVGGLVGGRSRSWRRCLA